MSIWVGVSVQGWAWVGAVGISLNGWILVYVGGYGWSGVDIYTVDMYILIFAIFHLNALYGPTVMSGDHIHCLKAIFLPYSSSSGITLGSSVVSQVIPVTIIDDAIPEIAQAFQLQLQSIELLNEPNFGRDFAYSGTDSLDQGPELGGNRLVEIIINENDDARGVVSFAASVYRVTEGAVAYINITRMGGTYGAIGVDYQIIGGSAVVGEDVRGSSDLQTILLQSDQSSATIALQIIDDSTPELQEQFTVQLLDADNGASLGDVTVTTVIISSSDAPSGVISFGTAEIAGLQINNPSVADGIQQVTLQVLRTGSLTGAVQVQWQVSGPVPGSEALDISQSTLQGILSFTDGQR